MVLLVIFLVISLIKPGISQSNNNDDISNTSFRSFCGPNAPLTLSRFINNRNSTVSQLRSQLSSDGVFYARAQSLSDGDSVFGDAQCRPYLTTAQCISCFDLGVSELIRCTTVSAHAHSYNCFFRYENYASYNNPETFQNPDRAADAAIATLGICGNQSASQSSSFSQDVEKLLSDIRVATPKTSNFYVASTRQISSENATVYAVAQCVQSTSQSICQDCLNRAHDRLYNCLPSTEGAFSYLQCFMRYSDAAFFNNNQTTDITNFLKGHSSKVPVIAVALGCVGLFIIVLTLTLSYFRWKKSTKTKEELNGAVYYNYNDLQLATDNFSKENMIGKGGFGEVFKATLHDKKIVAVKKIEVSNEAAKKEFENEVLLISNIQHINLLRLLGCSSEESNLLLVLEYMPNGSLDRFLWGDNKGTLNWYHRYHIIFGIARGLAHLHNEFHVKIVHRDIKSSNILLTDDFKPKIADFGLARRQPEDQTHVNTKFAGTLGYTAPEYAVRGLLSDKVDTYSFGIVILEIISGRRSTEVISDQPSTDYLLENAWKLYEKKIHLKLIDETLNLNQHEQEQVTKIIEIALLCTQSPVSNRPTMSEVVLMLQEGLSLGKRQLTRPTFVHNQERRIRIGSSKNPIAT